jgi:tetratricopeptide (TPR) repeat protein
MPPRQPPRGRGRPLPKKRTPREQPQEPEAPKTWGSLARKGVGRLRDGGPASAADAFREAAPPDRQLDQWIRTDVRDEAEHAVRRGAARPAPSRDRGRTRVPPPDVQRELEKAAGPRTAPRLGQRLAEASKAYERERYTDAKKLLKPLAERAPSSAAVRELYGLTLYRLGNWRLAAAELEAFRAMTGSTEEHPVLADCYRALKRYREVEELWEELRTASPSAELVAEGRIVMAGALADQGRTDDAMRLIEAGLKSPKRMKEHHLRMLYVLADLVERAGDVPRARQLFRKLADAAPDFADVQHRVRSLR